MTAFEDLVKKALSDPTYVDRLRADPKAALLEVGINDPHAAQDVAHVLSGLDPSHIAALLHFQGHLKNGPN